MFSDSSLSKTKRIVIKFSSNIETNCGTVLNPPKLAEVDFMSCSGGNKVRESQVSIIDHRKIVNNFKLIEVKRNTLR